MHVGTNAALYCLGSTGLRDFLQPLGFTAYKTGLSGRRYVGERVIDAHRNRYAEIGADVNNRHKTLFTLANAHEWFVSPLPDPQSDQTTRALLEQLPHASFTDGVITFRLPNGKNLRDVEKDYQKQLAPRNVNTYLATPDGRQRLRDAGHCENLRLFTDYKLVHPTRRSLWPAAGFVDTEIGCFMKPEGCHAETEVQSRVQG